jgi:hypothetical protein
VPFKGVTFQSALEFSTVAFVPEVAPSFRLQLCWQLIGVGPAAIASEYVVPLDGPAERTVGPVSFSLARVAAARPAIPTPDVTVEWENVGSNCSVREPCR